LPQNATESAAETAKDSVLSGIRGYFILTPGIKSLEKLRSMLRCGAQKKFEHAFCTIFDQNGVN
jgi:hypothetical protein